MTVHAVHDLHDIRVHEGFVLPGRRRKSWTESVFIGTGHWKIFLEKNRMTLELNGGEDLNLNNPACLKYHALWLAIVGGKSY